MGSGGRGGSTAQGTLAGEEGRRNSLTQRDSLLNAINSNMLLSADERAAYSKELLGFGNPGDQGFLATPDSQAKLTDFTNRYNKSATDANTRYTQNKTLLDESAKLSNTPNAGLMKPTPAQAFFGSIASQSITGK